MGSGSEFNCAARVGSGQTISGTGRVRASCRPLIHARKPEKNTKEGKVSLRSTDRFDEALGAIRQAGDVNFGVQFVVDGTEEPLWTADAHDGFFTDLHTDASHPLLHRDLQTRTAHQRDF